MTDDKELNEEKTQQNGSAGDQNTNGIENAGSEIKADVSGNGGDKKDECKEKDEIIRDWKNEYDELYDKYIRLYSEFENFRRRTSKEKLDMMEYANSNLILDILPVVDDFERAIRHMETAGDMDGMKNGINLIYTKFKKILEERGLKEIEAIGEDFNPDLHEAITKIPAPKRKLKDKIVDQIQKGYYLKDKVIRHSKVVVGE